MTDTNTILLYVTDATTSGRFYTRLLGREPVEASPTFVLFVLPSGLALGLWGKDGVEPAPAAAGGGSELGFKVASAAEVDAVRGGELGARAHDGSHLVTVIGRQTRHPPAAAAGGAKHEESHAGEL